MKKILKITVLSAILLILAGGVVSCKDKEDPIIGDTTGTIVGSYSNNGVYVELLVQVDEKYPIGSLPFDYVKNNLDCVVMPEGIYQNMIRVQPLWSSLSDVPEKREMIIGRRISFSYREYQIGEEGGINGDYHLFVVRSGVVHITPYCTSPDLPIYIITEYQFLN